MVKTIFWSWQSDLDARVTKDVVRYALDEAVKLLATELEEANRPSVTSDTQGIAGTPDIVATILRKIDEAAVFVGDVTPVALSENGKACANPNVLLEMGYANKALTEHRVIQVWNTAFEGATLEQLPFDMRGRRGPLSFNLPADADTPTLRTIRDKLARDLAGALKLALNTLPPPAPEAVHWHPLHPGDSNLWFDRTKPVLVTHPSHGSSRVRWVDSFPGYARLIPSHWSPKPGAKEALANNVGHPALMANANALSYGISRGGTMIYWPGAEEAGAYPTVAITQWFERTGEFWGVGGGFLFDRDGGITLATGYFFEHWLHFLQRNSKLALEYGGSLPIHVRLGVNGLADSWWPLGRFSFNDGGFGAVEDNYEFNAILTSVDGDYLKAVAVEAFNGLAAIYGIEAHTFDEIVALSR